MPKVLNIKTDELNWNCILIDRTTKWGNKYRIGIHGNRKEVVEMFRADVEKDKKFQKEIKKYLKGKDLVCHCTPLYCHGNILLEIANEE